MMPFRLLLLLGFVGILFAAAERTPFRERQARDKVALQCQKDLAFCSSRSRSVVESSLQKAPPCAQHNVPFVTFHRNSMLRDFDDFFDAITVLAPPSYERSDVSPRPHLRGTVHIMIYSVQTTHSSVSVSTNGWVVSSSQPRPTLSEPPSDAVLVTQRRRLQETAPRVDVSSAAAELPHVITEEELQCLKQYVLDDRVGGSSGCVEAMEEWQSLSQELSTDSANIVTEVVQTTTTTTANRPLELLLQKQQFHCIFVLMNILSLLALWITSGILCAACWDEKEDDASTADTSVEESEKSPLSFDTVLSVPKEEDEDPMVYIGVPLRIV